MKVTLIVFNRFFVLLISVLVLLSSSIYANEDTDVLPIKQQIHDSMVCSAAAKDVGSQYGVDVDLLQTIAVVESGRWDHLQNRYVAWPWTVNVQGKGYYYANREEAVAAIRKLKAAGVDNFDVGCMQINMKYHGHEFSSAEEALDPVKNVQYSARFLRRLYSANGRNWKQAAKRYHSSDPAQGAIYTDRLEKRFESYKVSGMTRKAQLF